MNRFSRTALLLIAIASLAGCARRSRGPVTQEIYLSGKGPGDPVQWDFMVTGGRRANEQATIGVPSHWELQGFGKYNYGYDGVDRGSPAGTRADEKGLYKLKFRAPAAWAGKRLRIVFDGVMTDAAVRINGQSAGPIHQGGFYRFKYDITDKVKPGEENLLEVDVSKASANALVEDAERIADYWIFGGIFRPVWVEALPQEFIDWTAVDAEADGAFSIDVHPAHIESADRIRAQIVDAKGKKIGKPFDAPVAPGAETVRLETRIDAPALWTAETPNLYGVEVALMRGGEEVHLVRERFGFRTFEVRVGQGFFLNGQRILLKGVCRHSFRPETGRALDAKDNYDDVRLIKEMNMNAVRMSHYPPDKSFLEACDELGLYVLDELAGWQRQPYDTEVGEKLVREMLVRDVNHPSIIFWDNGNEGGWNTELDDDFHMYDPQQRVVLHPWNNFNGVNTFHYPNWRDLTATLAGQPAGVAPPASYATIDEHRAAPSPSIGLATEVLHGLHDGGHGAALEDYWNAYKASPVGGGLFLWDFADAGIVRTDQQGKIDVFDTFGADGIFGPHFEKEGSFYTIKKLFSPVQVDEAELRNPGRRITLRNEYSFTNLNQCKFSWRLVGFQGGEEQTLQSPSREVQGPDVPPGGTGILELSYKLEDGAFPVALELTAIDPNGAELWSWRQPVRDFDLPSIASDASARRAGDDYVMEAAGTRARFNGATGELKSLEKNGRTVPVSAGPRLTWETPTPPNRTQWESLKRRDSAPGSDAANVARAFDAATTTSWNAREAGDWIVGELASPAVMNAAQVWFDRAPGSNWGQFKLEVTENGVQWHRVFEGSMRENGWHRFDFAPRRVAAMRLTAGLQSTEVPFSAGMLRLGADSGRFPASAAAPKVSAVGNGLRVEAGGLEAVWSIGTSGELSLDYKYTLPQGDYAYHGITFDLPEEQVTGMKWFGEGPYRVWKNRLPGTWLGFHGIDRNDNPPGMSWNYPNFKGYFAGMRWLRLALNGGGSLAILADGSETYFRTWTPSPNIPDVSPAFPTGDISFLHAIPPIGSKSKPASGAGPKSELNHDGGVYEGRLNFRVE